MEEQQPQPALRRSKPAVFSTLFAIVSVALFFVPPGNVADNIAAVLLYAAVVSALAALVTGWLGLLHIKHDAGLVGKTYAWLGVGIALAEILYGTFVVGNALGS